MYNQSIRRHRLHALPGNPLRKEGRRKFYCGWVGDSDAKALTRIGKCAETVTSREGARVSFQYIYICISGDELGGSTLSTVVLRRAGLG